MQGRKHISIRKCVLKFSIDPFLIQQAIENIIEMIIIITLIVLLLTVAIWKLDRCYNYWIERSVKQRKQIYILGDNASFLFRKESLVDLVISMYKAFPNERYVGAYDMTTPILLVRDPDIIKQVTIKDFDHFVNHQAFVPEGLDPLWNKNLFSLRDSAWREMRQTLSPTFTSTKMKTMFKLIAECADEFTDYFLEKGDGTPLEMKDTFSRYTNDIIASIAFGIKCDSIGDRNNKFYTLGIKATKLDMITGIKFLLFAIAPWLCKAVGLTFFPKDAAKFFVEIVKETIQARESQGIVRHDMIHLLLEARKAKKSTEIETNGVPDTGFATVDEALESNETKSEEQVLTDMDIAAQAMIFFFGGFETVSTLMTFAAYELMVNPEIQQKLQAEIDETSDECGNKLTYEALMKMKYMDMVVSEILRKWPPSLITDRRCTKTYIIQPTNENEKPVEINAGSCIWIPTIGLHRDPEYYPDPEKFDPERFSEENKTKINPYAYIPFGTGPRNCIGSRFALMETKAILFYMLSKFDFCVSEKTEVPLKLSKTAMQLWVENGVWVDLRPRKR